MYRRPKFLEVLLDIRQEMARVADYDVDLFAEMVRTGNGINGAATYRLVEPGAENGTSAGTKRSRPKESKVIKKV
jgi:hypothetical protein